MHCFHTRIVFTLVSVHLLFSSSNAHVVPIALARIVHHKVGSKSSIYNNQLYSNVAQKETKQKNLLLEAHLGHKTTVFSPSLIYDPRSETFSNPAVRHVTSVCARQISSIIRKLETAIRDRSSEKWMFQMIDSSGVLPKDVIDGRMSDPGGFHECVQIQHDNKQLNAGENENVRGQYCSTYLIPEAKLAQLENSKNGRTFSSRLQEDMVRTYAVPLDLPMVGVCLPASCSLEDAQVLLSFINSLNTTGFVDQVVAQCYTNEKPPFDHAVYFVMSFLVVLAVLCISGSIYDIYWAKNCSDDQSMVFKILLAFSFYTNTKRWLSTGDKSDQFSCMHGIRCCTMACILLGHTVLITVTQITWNVEDLNNLYKDWTMYPVLNISVNVDTFYTLSGTLVSYYLLKELDKRNGNFNYYVFALHRFLRVTPTYMTIIGLIATLLPFMGTGPLWFVIEDNSENCRRYWWHNLFFINNLIGYDTNMCHGVSWYLATDTQFFLLSPLVILPLWRKPKTGLHLAGILLVLSVAIPSSITYLKHLPPVGGMKIPFKSYMDDIYIKPWTRFGPYLIGLLCGWVLHRGDKSPQGFENMPKSLIVTGWILSSALATVTVVSGIYYLNPENVAITLDSWHAALYSGLHRVVWSVSISWVIFACATGNGGFVDTFLSLQIFVPIGRLSFCMYLSSYYVQLAFHLMQPYAVYYSKYSMMYLFFGHLITCTFVAYVLTMCLESPIRRLEKMMVGKFLKAKPKESERSEKRE